MLWWTVDNLGVVFLILAVVIICFGWAWLATRNAKLLIGIGVPIALMILAWVLSLYIITDRAQLVLNVETMRDLVNASKLDDALQHFDDEVTFDTMGGEIRHKRADLQQVAKATMKHYGVKKIDIWGIQVEASARPKATVTFYLKPQDSEERGRCTMGFVYKDGKWLVNTLTVESLVGGKKSPLLLPF